MAGITLTQAETMLTEAVANLSAVRTSQEYKMGGVFIRRSLLAEANNDVTHWNNVVIQLSRTGSTRRVRRFIPTDG